MYLVWKEGSRCWVGGMPATHARCTHGICLVFPCSCKLYFSDSCRLYFFLSSLCPQLWSKTERKIYALRFPGQLFSTKSKSPNWNFQHLLKECHWRYLGHQNHQKPYTNAWWVGWTTFPCFRSSAGPRYCSSVSQWGVLKTKVRLLLTGFQLFSTRGSPQLHSAHCSVMIIDCWHWSFLIKIFSDKIRAVSLFRYHK